MSLRVAMVVDRFPAETFLAQQVAELTDRGVDVHVLCQINDEHARAWSLLEGIDLTGKIHPWPDRGERSALARRAMATLASATARNPAAMRRALSAERRVGGSGWPGRLLFDARLLELSPDVVHFQFADLARHRVHVATALDVAFTSSFRGYDLSYAGLEEPGFYDLLWPNLDGAHTLGRDLHDLAIDRGCPPDVDWTIISPAVDIHRFDPGDRMARIDRAERSGGWPIRIISVGRLHWKKGHLDALSAVAGLRATGREVRYRIVGAGPAEEAVRWAIRDLGLSDAVELIGHSTPDEVRDHLRWADVFLHAALSEGFANAVLEAQAMALPVVCTDAEGLAENIADDLTGFVVPRRRPELLTEKLVILAEDPDRRRRMGSFGRQRVKDHFDLDAQTDALVEFFQRSAKRAARGGR